MKNYKIQVIKENFKFPMVRFIDIDQANENPIDMNDIQEWCVENECGWRTSYDMFKFRNEEQLMIFLIRWG